MEAAGCCTSKAAFTKRPVLWLGTLSGFGMTLCLCAERIRHPLQLFGIGSQKWRFRAPRIHLGPFLQALPAIFLLVLLVDLLTDGSLCERDVQLSAAGKAEFAAGTPVVSYLDSLLVLLPDRVKYPDLPNRVECAGDVVHQHGMVFLHGVSSARFSDSPDLSIPADADSGGSLCLACPILDCGQPCSRLALGK